jgi:hypothetical protein
MRYYNTSIWLFMVFIIAGTTSSLAQSKIGTSAAPFLGIAVGPHGNGMGGASVALSSDATSLYYNPGAISQIGFSEVYASHTQWIVETSFDWIGTVINIDGTNAVGVSVTQLNYGEEEVTTIQSQMGTGEQWSAADIAVALSYARNLTDKFSIGGSAKFIQQRIWNSSASSFALDVGLLYKTDFNGLNIGMSISNFGADMRMDGKDLFVKVDNDADNTGSNKKIPGLWKTDEWPLPLIFRAGISLDVVKMDDIRVIVAADALRPSDSAETLNIGGEFSWREMVYFRGGVKSLFLPDRQEGFNVGGGLKYEVTGLTAILMDYSYQQFGILGGIQTFGIGVTF